MFPPPLLNSLQATPKLYSTSATVCGTFSTHSMDRIQLVFTRFSLHHYFSKLQVLWSHQTTLKSHTHYWRMYHVRAHRASKDRQYDDDRDFAVSGPPPSCNGRAWSLCIRPIMRHGAGYRLVGIPVDLVRVSWNTEGGRMEKGLFLHADAV